MNKDWDVSTINIRVPDRYESDGSPLMLRFGLKTEPESTSCYSCGGPGFVEEQGEYYPCGACNATGEKQ